MIVCLDNEWQTPAITEKDAFDSINNIQEMDLYSDALYIAFPWANLIDSIDCQWEKKEYYINCIKEISKLAKAESIKGRKIFTTCQHVWAFREEFSWMFEECCIDKIFWPHKPNDISNLHASDDHPFYREGLVGKFVDKFNVSPHVLFPVQAQETLSEDQFFSSTKKYLASFSGMVFNSYCVNDERQQIKEKLSGEETFFIKDTGDWFYNKNVYKGEKQVSNNGFADLLKESIFSLCPSGTGPNSIRLWESINLGSIPVFFKSRQELVKINSCQWSDSCIFIEDYGSIDELPKFLKSLHPKNILERQEALFMTSKELTSLKNQHLIEHYLV